MGKVLVVTARKGGCGKSMTTASLGVGLARQGKRTLIIDTDNQHSLTISMGVTEPDKLPVTLTSVITDIIAEKNIDPTLGIIHHAEGIDLMPANNSLTGIELTLSSFVIITFWYPPYIHQMFRPAKILLAATLIICECSE